MQSTVQEFQHANQSHTGDSFDEELNVFLFGHRSCSICFHSIVGLTGVVTTIVCFPEHKLTTATTEVVVGIITTPLWAVTSRPRGIGQFIKSTRDAAGEAAAVDVS